MPTYKAATNPQVGSSAYGNVFQSDAKVTPPVALLINDVLILNELPAGTRLTGLRYRNEDFDTATTMTFNLGYRSTHPAQQVAAAPTYFLSASTALRAAQATWVDLAFEPITFQEPVQIVLLVTAAPTGVSGTPALWSIASGSIVGVS